ncbi:hypothetical protein QZH41_020764 [Actinostola sp. cb2023]|nr:hypothetical protein QZH41_020764 [Actinostola sp. cb2023]
MNYGNLLQDHHCFTKTECYHYFHSYCLLRYIEYHLKKAVDIAHRSMDKQDKQIVCPMCRLPITYDMQTLKAAPDIDAPDEEVVFRADVKMKRLQQKMAKLYDEQFKKGGIINEEEEKNRYLIIINEVIVVLKSVRD